MTFWNRFLSLILTLAIVIWPTSADAMDPKFIPECPKISWTGSSDPGEPKVFGFMFTGTREFYQRVDASSKRPVELADSLIGCYISGRISFLPDSKVSLAGTDWSIGVIDRDSLGYFWRNAANFTWRLTPDFSQNRMKTGSDYPYRAYGDLVELSIPFDSNKPESCQLMEYGQNFSPGFSRRSWLFYGKDVIRYKVIVPTFAGENSPIDPKQTFDGLETSKVIDYYKAETYGKVTLKFDYAPLQEKIPGKASDYYETSFDLMKLAYKAFVKVNPQIDYEGIIVSLPKEYTNKDAGYASSLNLDFVTKPEDTKIGLIWMGAAPFNWGDPYAPPWKVVAHEVGHNFGLADLYATATDPDNYSGRTIGPFDMMGSISAPGNEFSFWSRWMTGWLADNQVRCITDGTSGSTTSLSSVGTNDGLLKGIVIPLTRFTALLIESRKSQGYDSTLKSDEVGLVVYKIDTQVRSGGGPIQVIPKINQYTDTKYSNALHDKERFLKAPLQVGDSLTSDGYTIINVGDSSSDKALVIKGDDPRPMATVTSQFAKEYGLSAISIPLAIQSDSSAGFTTVSKQKSICTVADGKIYLRGAGTCELSVTPKADPQFKTSIAQTIQFNVLDDRAQALDKNIYYFDNGSCNARGIGAALQILKDGTWVDFVQVQGWNDANNCDSDHPVQPWAIVELPSAVQYRWRYFAQGWSTDFYSQVGTSPLTAADFAAKIKADQEAAAAEAKAKADAIAAANAKLKADALNKKTTITCIKGKTTKKVTAVNPKCPTGYKKK